ncbi:MAG: hypothetical protein AAFQ68_04805 [Bacteroidota bacterium]
MASSTIHLTAQPPGFVQHTHRFEVVSKRSRDEIWTWLNTPETFTKNQVWPFRVEFVSPEEGGKADFSVGVLNVHHGPLLNFAGVLTEIQEGRYRDLHYYYGSYALSLRWIRPTRLQFWLEDMPDGGCKVIGQVDSFVKPAMAGFWSFAQRFFWGQFRWWMPK